MSQFVYRGKTITAATISEKQLRLTFNDGKVIAIRDNGQSCCESRYMRTDDDIQSLVGGKFLHVTGKNTVEIEEGYGVHEIVFVEVATDKGCITISNHNEHNGYYSGFGLTIIEEF